MEFIGTEAAAKILDMHPGELRARASKKEIPGYKFCGRWKFDPEELEAFVKKGKNTPEEVGHKENLCRKNSYHSKKEGKFGTTRTPRQMANAYAEVLGLPIKTKQCN
ncbi:helix-turn-helix domain-containing protein [[Haemophilus] felis]|nr:helix-turn-helix domain-containing protein [[Haemophilus] felis]